MAGLAANALAGATVALAADEAAIEAATAADGVYARLNTSLGTIVCRIETERVPVTAGNFVGLAEGTLSFRDPKTQEWVKRPFYDGLTFHRVVQGFVVQGGDPLGDGTGGPGYEFIDEFDPALSHTGPGVLSMANSGPGTNGSQFFITLAAAPHLDRRHSVFGNVVFGMDVLQAMAAEPMTGPEKSRPAKAIVIQNVSIIRRGKAARAFDAAAAFAMQEQIVAARERERQEKAQRFQRELSAEAKSADSTASGLRFWVRTPGKGDPPVNGDMVEAHYTGYLEDGTQFDSSYERGAGFRFPVGNGRVIKGWDEVFLLMRAGEKRRVIIPPQLAYGKTGFRRYGIPADATLVFDLELIQIMRRP